MPRQASKPAGQRKAQPKLDNLVVVKPSEWHAYVEYYDAVKTKEIVPATWIKDFTPPVFTSEEVYDCFWTADNHISLQFLRSKKKEIPSFPVDSSSVAPGFYKARILIVDISKELVQERSKSLEERKNIMKRAIPGSKQSTSSKESGISSVASSASTSSGKSSKSANTSNATSSLSQISSEDIDSHLIETANDVEDDESPTAKRVRVDLETQLKECQSKLRRAKAQITKQKESHSSLEKEVVQLRELNSTLLKQVDMLITSNRNMTERLTKSPLLLAERPSQEDFPDLSLIDVGEDIRELITPALLEAAPLVHAVGQAAATPQVAERPQHEAALQLNNPLPAPQAPRPHHEGVLPPAVQPAEVLPDVSHGEDAPLAQGPPGGGQVAQGDGAHDLPLAGQPAPQVEVVQAEAQGDAEQPVQPEMVEIHANIFIDRRAWTPSFKEWVLNCPKKYGYGTVEDKNFLKDAAMNLWGSQVLMAHSVSGKITHANANKNPNLPPPRPPLPLHEVLAIKGVLERRVRMEKAAPVPPNKVPDQEPFEKRTVLSRVKFEIGQKINSLRKRKN